MLPTKKSDCDMAKRRELPNLSLDFVPGRLYLSVLCRSCGKVVPITNVDEPDCWSFRGLVNVRCPFCRTPNRYSRRDASALALKEKLPDSRGRL